MYSYIWWVTLCAKWGPNRIFRFSYENKAEKRMCTAVYRYIFLVMLWKEEKNKEIICLSSFHVISVFFLPGVYWYLHCRNVCQTGCNGPILLFPGRMEYFWWNYRELEFNGVGLGRCRRSFCAEIIPIGKHFYCFRSLMCVRVLLHCVCSRVLIHVYVLFLCFFSVNNWSLPYIFVFWINRFTQMYITIQSKIFFATSITVQL